MVAAVKTKKRSIFDSVLVASLLVILVNAVFVGVIVALSRYIQVQARYFAIGICIIVILILILNLCYLFGYAKRVRSMRRITVFFGAVMLIVGSVGFYYVFRTNAIVDQIINSSGEESVAVSLVSFDPLDDLETMDGKTVAYVIGDEDYNALVKEKLTSYSRTLTITGYETLSDLLFDSLDKQFEYALLPKNYASLSESFPVDQDPFATAKTLETFSTQVNTVVSDVDVLTEPFTMLMLGNNEGLSDSIILATFNPTTLKVTMTSVARDSYVPIACQQGRRDKINHARGISRQCMIETVENYLGVGVDFYFETDFYAIVKIVDALGGLDINSPVAFTGTMPVENTDPQEYVDIDVPAGMNHLNGSQVLTFARERNHIEGSDFGRQMNQQYVISEVAQALISTKNPNTILQVLDAAKDNISTNLQMSDISALVGYAIQETQGYSDPMGVFRIVQSQILGADHYTPNGTYVMLPYTTHIRNTQRVIDANMETEVTLLHSTSMTFTLLEPYDSYYDSPLYEYNTYELWTDGTIDTSNDTDDDSYYEEEPEPIEVPDVEQPATQVPEEVTPPLEPVDPTPQPQGVVVPDFSSMGNDAIRAWGSSHGVTIVFGTVDKTDATMFENDQFWSQSILPGETVTTGSTIQIIRVRLVEGTQ